MGPQRQDTDPDQSSPNSSGGASSRRDVRRLAMQVLFQIDQRGEADCEQIRLGMPLGPDDQATQDEAFELAQAAWRDRKQADLIVTELAPQWPTHRQPPVDRALLRLAYHEIVAGRTPFKIAINEAVELAKKYGARNSPMFINGVLDKLAKKVVPEERRNPDGPET